MKKRFPLATTIANRTTVMTKDALRENCLLEKTQEGDLAVVKRPGVTLQNAAQSGSPRGVFYWNGEVLSVWGTTLYRGSTSVGTVNGSDRMRFAVANDDGNEVLMLFGGSSVYSMTTGWTLTTIAPGVLTGFTGKINGIAFVNGFVVFMNQNGDLLHSNWRRVDTYTTTDRVEHDGTPETFVAFAKVNRTVILLGERTIRAFQPTIPPLDDRPIPGATQSIASKTGSPRGCYYWNGEILSVWGTTLYHGNTSVGTVSGTGQVYFEEFGSATKYLIVADNSNAYRLSTAWSLTSITDADFTALGTRCDGPTTMDGYLFWMNTQGQILHSDLDDATAYNALNVLTAEAYSDQGIFLTRHMNYIVAFGERSIEFFYDAANASGSVLRRVPGQLSAVGCVSSATVAKQSDVIAFLGQVGGGRSVFLMEQGRPRVISTPALDRALTSANVGGAKGYIMRINGRLIYGLMLPNESKTYWYDFGTQRWFEVLDGTGSYWPYWGACTAPDGAVYFISTEGVYTPSSTRSGDAYLMSMDMALFQRIADYNKEIGCLSNESVAVWDESLFFLGNVGQNRGVYRVNQAGVQLISPPNINRMLNESTLSGTKGDIIVMHGHVIYQLQMSGDGFTYWYDMAYDDWSLVKDTSGNYWPYWGACVADDGKSYVISTGGTYRLTGASDAGSGFTMKVRTDALSFGTMDRKILNALEVECDAMTGTFSLRYSDDDFSSYSTARTLYAARPRALNLGMFRRRAFELSHSDNEFVRIHAVNMDIEKIEDV